MVKSLPIYHTPESDQKRSIAMKKWWSNPKNRADIMLSITRHVSEPKTQKRLKEQWRNPIFVTKWHQSRWGTVTQQTKHSENIKRAWNDPTRKLYSKRKNIQ